uniref:Putative secreted protein synganglion overexpressed n=1 Tax=Rhipicephalus microplus TaxID=6941 RepID=A0A6M2D9S1_RHIMP
MMLIFAPLYFILHFLCACAFCFRWNGLFMIILFLTGRGTKFRALVLNKGDAISKWSKAGLKDAEAFCILCSVTIYCAQHGTAAVKGHASQKKHLEAAAKRRDASGVLLAPKTVQATIDFSQGTPRATLQDQVCGAGAIFAMAVVSKDIPYARGITATDIYKKMFTDSDVAKNFNCARAKLS